jgi:squalene synthase HpnC
LTAVPPTPSGKSAATENFPVGSFLIRPDLRPHVHTFYRFARTADDVADSPSLSASEKLRRLDRMAEALLGYATEAAAEVPAAQAMRASLAATGVAADHCMDLLEAFRRDATKLRYADWDELMAYCRLSAMPVGRYVLDLHGEPRAAWASSDALCAALQVLNHLQDCAEDHRLLDRVYLPLDILGDAGAVVEDLARPGITPGLRRTVDRLLDRTERLNTDARGLPRTVRDWRLRCETGVIVAISVRLTRSLRRRDPLAERVRLGRQDLVLAAASGLATGIAGRMAA